MLYVSILHGRRRRSQLLNHNKLINRRHKDDEVDVDRRSGAIDPNQSIALANTLRQEMGAREACSDVNVCKCVYMSN